MAQDDLTVAEDAVTLSMLGMGGAAFQVKGTFTGTITFEATVDGGVWAALNVVGIGATAKATTTTAAGIFIASVAGLYKIRARMSAYTDGYATVTIRSVVCAPSLPFLS
jgi:hypothetical protein